MPLKANFQEPLSGKPLEELLETLAGEPERGAPYCRLDYLLAPDLHNRYQGMNLEHMPELSTRYGYFVVLGVLFTLTYVICYLLHK